MKKFLKMRKRGYDLLQISLGVIVILGGMVAGLLLYSQITVGTDTADLTRRGAAISSEVRGLYRTEASFVGVGNAEIEARTGVTEAMLNNITIAGVDAQTFTLSVEGLTTTVCNRLENDTNHLGPNSTVGDIDCENGDPLLITYTR